MPSSQVYIVNLNRSTCILILNPTINVRGDRYEDPPPCIQLLFMHVYHSEITVCVVPDHCLFVLTSSSICVYVSSFIITLSPIHHLTIRPVLRASLPHPFPPWFSLASPSVRPSVRPGTYCLLVCSIVLLPRFAGCLISCSKTHNQCICFCSRIIPALVKSFRVSWQQAIKY